MTELKNVLSGSLLLAALWAYLRYARLGVYAPAEADPGPAPAAPPDTPAPPPRSEIPNPKSAIPWPFYILSLLLFTFALLAKTATSLLIVGLLLVLWWQRGRVTWRDLLALAPFVVITLALGRLTLRVEWPDGLTGPLYDLAFVEKCLIAGRAFWFYLGKLLWPHPLLFIYPRWRIDPTAWTQYLYPLAFLLLVLGLWLFRRRLGRAPLAAVLYAFVGTGGLIFIVVIYMTRFSWVSDHWQYFASMSLIALFAAALARALQRFGATARAAAPAALVLLLAVPGALAWRQSRIYRDRPTLWAHNLAHDPSCALAHTDLGAFLMVRAEDLVARGRADAARADFAAAHAHFQAATTAQPEAPDAWYHLGCFHQKQGDLRAAETCFRRAIALEPGSAKSYLNLGIVLSAQARFPEALAQLRFVQQRFAPGAEVYYNLGVIYARMGQPGPAISAFEQALVYEPDAVPVLSNRGAILVAIGRTEPGLARLRRALALDPRSGGSHHMLGEGLWRAGREAEALAELQRAVELCPDLLNAWVLLGAIHRQAGRLDAAVSCYEQARRVAPEDLQVQVRLADAYAAAGRFPDAQRTAEAALAAAGQRGDAPLVAHLGQRLEAFRAGKP